MLISTTATPAADSNFDDVVGRHVRDYFVEACGTSPRQLFTTDVTGLYDLFVETLPAELRQHHNCRACRTFVERFGGLVYLIDGVTHTPFWSERDIPDPFGDGIRAMRVAACRAKVTGVYYSPESVWGQPVTGKWHHFAVEVPKAMRWKVGPRRPQPEMAQLAAQASALKLEEFGMLKRALADYSPEVVSQAVALLDTETLYRSEKVLGVARWLAGVQAELASTKNVWRRDNIVWAAVASAPTGYAHARSSMIGTLLDDLAAGVPAEEVKRKFAAKMHPLQYQRPTAAPSVGNIREAEKIIAELGAAGALARRFAKLEDLRPLWTPRPNPSSVADKVAEGGMPVFGHLLLKPSVRATDIDATSKPLTWEKFARTVLDQQPEAVDIYAPAHGNYCAIITAASPDARPIIQWDSDDDRCPLSWYVYLGGSSASAWRVTSGWQPLTAITLQPNMYKQGFAHQGAGVMFIIRGAQDSHHTKGGGLFVEQLRSEVHAIRSTLEAFIKSASVAGRDDATACGLVCTKGQPWGVLLRVTKNSIRTTYKLDRWD